MDSINVVSLYNDKTPFVKYFLTIQHPSFSFLENKLSKEMISLCRHSTGTNLNTFCFKLWKIYV